MHSILNAFSLSGKTILVTGSSSGIGRSVAKVLSSQGANIILSGRNEDRLNEALLSLHAGNHRMVAADLSDEEQINKLADSIDQIHGIVHCAGIMKTLPFKFLTKEIVDEVMLVNFIGPLLLTKQLISKKKIEKKSSIVFISSVSSHLVGAKGNSIYSSSKGAINGLIPSMALELANQSIRVNAVAPGMIKTEMWSDAGMISHQQLKEDEKKYPLGYGDPEDVAWACSFLVSEASKWMTGNVIVLDGGFSIQ